MGSLLQKLSRAIWGTSPQNTSIDVDPITTALGTTSSTYAGIARNTTTNAFWNSNGTNGVETLSAAETLVTLQSSYGDVTFGNEEPDTIIYPQAGFNKLWSLMVGQQRYMRDEETTRAGFKRHLMFNNAVVLHDQFVPASSRIMLNSKYVYPCFLDRDYFVVDPFIRPSNQRVLSSFIWVTWNLKFVNPRMCGRTISITF